MGDRIQQVVLDGLQVFLLLEALPLLLHQPGISSLVISLGIKGAAVLELEDLLLDVGSLIILGVSGVGLLEVELVEVVPAVRQQLLSIQELYIGGSTSSRRSSSR